MLNGRRKTCNRFLIRWPVCKVRNRLSKSFVNVLCIYILIILINDFYCLSVSADTDAPAAIMINSNLTRRLKHMVRVSAWTECDYKWGRHFYSRSARRTDCRCDMSRRQRHPAALHAAWCFNYRYAGQMHASVSKGQTGSWSLTLPCFK